MSAEDTIQPKFYSVWPNTGKKFSQQLGEIRTDTSTLTPIARAVGFDTAGDWSDLDGIAANSVQAYEVGQDGYHNRFRTHYNKDDDLFEIASNHGTEDVPQWYTMWWVNNDGHVTQQNTPTTVSNIGSGEGWFKQKVGVDLEFKSITATSPITIVNDGNSIDIDGSDLISNYSSLGGASDVITAKSGSILPFKGFSAGPNMVVRDQGTYLEFESTAQVVEFYGIRMSHSDAGTSFPEVHHLIVNREDFYLTQETTHPSEKTIILNNISDPFNSSDYVAVIGDDMTGQLAMHDGTAGEPAIGFTSDTTMGLYRNAANDLGVVIDGAAHTRFLSDRLFLAQDLQVTAGGSAASPDIYFFPDSDTGVYQPELDSIGFTTGGTRAGWFTSNQDFYVTGRILVGNGSQANPSMVFGSDQELGLNRESAGILNINSAGAVRLQVASDEIVPTVPVRPNFDGTSSSVAYGWDSDVGTGFFLSTSGGNSTLALAVDTSTVMEVGVNAGQFKTFLPLRTTVAGTENYPSYSWFDSTGTGLYLYAAEELGFSSGASAGDGSHAGHIDENQKWWFDNDIDVVGDVDANTVTVVTEVYGAGWDGDNTVPTKDAVYDKIESLDTDEYFDNIYVANEVNAQIGFFYTSLHIGGHTPGGDADNDEMWKLEIKGDTANTLDISPTTPSRTADLDPGARLNFNAQLDLLPDIGTQDPSGDNLQCITLAKNGFSMATFPKQWVLINAPASVEYTGVSCAGNVVNVKGTHTATTDTMALPFIQTFLDVKHFTCSVAGGKTTGGQSYMATPTYKNATTLANTVAQFTDLENCSFKSRPVFLGQGDGGSLTTTRHMALLSTFDVSTNHAGATTTVQEFDDILFKSSTSAGAAGTEDLQWRAMVYMEDETLATRVDGIYSEITAGSTKKLINSIGDVVSYHKGDFEVGNDIKAGRVEAGIGSFYTTLITADDPYSETDWDGDFTVPTKNAVRDAIAGIGPGFYGVTFRESEDGGAAYQTDALTVDSGIFYLSTGGDGKPLLSQIGLIGVTDKIGIGTSTGYPIYVTESKGLLAPRTDPDFRFDPSSNRLIVSTLTTVNATAGSLGWRSGSITDSSGAISFGNENLSTTGTLGCGALTCTTINTGTGARELDQDVISGAAPTFTGTNITGVPAESVLAGEFGTGAYTFDSQVYQKVQANNVTYGAGAGESIVSGANHNTCIGFYTGTSITVSDDNTLIGYNAGVALISSGNSNTFIGSRAGALQLGSDNGVAIGFEAGMANNVFGSAVMIGYQAGKANLNGQNTFIGYQAGAVITSTTNNTFIGYKAGYQANTGSGNVCIGSLVGQSLVAAGNNNTLVGTAAGDLLEDGPGNTLLGNKAGDKIVSGENNCIVGQSAGGGGDFSNGTMFGSTAGRDNTGTSCTLIGNTSGRLNTGNSNTTVGSATLYDNEGGAFNTAIGHDALGNSVSGDYNVAIGYRASRIANGGGDHNIAIGGYSQGNGNGERFRNTTMGYRSGYSISTGDDNVLIGHEAGRTVATSNKNTVLGNYAGYALTGGSNVFLGYYAGRYQVATSDKLIIDNRSQGSSANELTRALIVGDFHATPSSQTLTFNADTTITYKLRSTAQAGGTTDGDIWNDSTQKALQTFVAGIEQSLSGCIFTQTADQTIANTTTETTMFGTGVGTLTLPANFWTVGKTIRLEIHGDFADTGNPTAEIKVLLDAVVMSDSTAITLSGLGGTEEWETEVIMTCRSTGGSGTIETVVDWEYETTTGSSAIERLDISGTLQTVDTTQADTLDVTFQWGTAHEDNTLHSHVGFVQVLN